jgi:hypothetical protein
MRHWSYPLMMLFVSPLVAAADPALLKAISFALTGSDGSNFEFSDAANCTVHRVVSSAHGHGEETYYLGRIDPSRTVFTEYTQKYPQYAMSQSFSTVELHGEGTVYEYHWITDRPVFDNTFTTADHEITVYTSEHSRLLRAWKYIYLHGCQGAHSSY